MRVKFEAVFKYHEWSVVFMPNITYKIMLLFVYITTRKRLFSPVGISN